MEAINEPTALKVIKTDEEYEQRLAELQSLLTLDPPDYSAENDRLELLLVLVKEYESRVFTFEAIDPVDAILFRMEQQGLTPKDLIPYLGSRSKVSEVLNHKRPLSLTMIRALHDGLGIPLESLIN